MSEIRLPVERFSPQIKEVKPVEPVYIIGDVSYYDRLPSEPTERSRHTLLPMSLVGDWVRDFVDDWNSKNDKKKNIGWKVDMEDEALINPNFGSAQHYAEVNYDAEGNLTNFISDGILWENGKLDTRTGIATPGSVVAPIEKREDGYYVHCFWQWRPAPMDSEIKVPAELTDPKDIEEFKALNTGEWFLTTPGGFASFVGDKAEDVAKREALEEAGLRVEKPVFDKKSFNRANIRTKINVGFSTFERIGDEMDDEGEKLFGKMAVRIDKFRTTDDMVSAAVNFAREELDLISSGN
jgi:8-oxo-dGTP pyrophosphatase MutT (NUDIX family)